MNPGQPCDMAGKNIKDETNNKKAWVDLKGNKYMYNDETWKNKGKSCNISPVSISPDEFSSIKIKGNMTNASFCNELDIDDSVLKKIMKLNKRLVVLGEKIAKNLKNVIIKDINNEKTINVEKKKLEKHLSMLKSDNENINNYTDRHNTVIGQNENARLYARSNFLQLLVFFIMAVVITVLSIKAFFIGSSRSMEILAIIMGILMVYFLANYISEKYI
jgi:regulator of replication initiation timing